jgi:glyoxylase-like metal-dependent hydrolase (beta-lactamase superfamily II)
MIFKAHETAPRRLAQAHNGSEDTGMSAPLQVEGRLHGGSSTICYIAFDPETKRGAIIDPVLDFDQTSGGTSTAFANSVADRVEALGLTVDWVLETHVHADHLSGAQHMRERLGGQVAIGAHIDRVQTSFAKIYNLGADFQADGSQFDMHTPACVCYHIGDAVFTGDTIFMPDFGTARCDFPGGDARDLYRSIHRVLALPGETRIFVGHDYAPGGRDHAWETTVAAERATNKHVQDGVDEESFVTMRRERDAELSMPGLLLPALQVNIRAGNMPEPEDNGVTYLKVPINQF